jgi:hypothetical protein
MMSKLIAVSLLLFSAFERLGVDAFRTGAGGCDGGMAAVGGLHLDNSNGREVMESTLSEGAISVSINGQILSTTTQTDLPIGRDLVLSVNADDIPYKGVLVRLEAPSGVATGGALVPDANTQNAIICMSPVVGITHTDSSEKSMATGTIRFDEEVLNVALDVTVVFENSAVSAYVYSRLLVNFRATPIGTPTTTPFAPSTPPVAPIPIASPTNLPTSSPPVAPSPITSPTNLPTSSPVLVPVLAPSPIASPINQPTTSPVSVPVVTSPSSAKPTSVDGPTDLPTSAPLDAPVPVRAPIFEPVSAQPATDEPDSKMPSGLENTFEPTHEKLSKGKMSKGMMMMMMGKKMKGGKKMSGKGEGMIMRGKGGMMGKVEDVFIFNEEYEDSLHDDIGIRAEHKDDETHNEALNVHKIDHIP